jgi:UDP-perosamine 4-acetyltransferase
VCLEALLDDPANEVVGAVSSDGTGVANLGVPIVGRDTDLLGLTESMSVDTVCVAIGDNAVRHRVVGHALANGLSLATATSRFAMISRSVTVGPGTVLLPGAVVNAATTIGTGAIVNTNASIDHDCVIGDAVHVAPGSTLGGGVTVGDGAFVGLGARILPGVTVGRWAVVGAGAVVVHDVEAGSVVVGNPARVLRSPAPPPDHGDDRDHGDHSTPHGAPG